MKYSRYHKEINIIKTINITINLVKVPIQSEKPKQQIYIIKLKIQIKIQGEELRAQGKKRADLQEAISAIQNIDIGLPIEFINFRD